MITKQALIHLVVVVPFAVLTAMAPGCALGPNYKRPQINSPSAWKGEEASVPSAVSQVLSEKWWALFNDEKLSELMEEALKSNQNLKSAVARVIQARSTARVASSDLWPSLNMTPAMTRSQQSANRFEISTFEQPNGILSNDFRTPLDLSYELDIWGKVRRSFESSRAEAEASEEDYKTILLTLTADLAKNYYFVRGLDSDLKILGETKDLRERGLAVVNDRFRAGLVSELDLARAKTELASVEVETIDIKRRRAELVNALALLCGQPASLFSLEAKVPDFIPPQVPAGLPSALLERRPDVIRAEKKMVAANAAIGVAQASFFPVVRLTGLAGYQSFETSSLFDGASRVWSLGPSIGLPLFLGGRNKANLEKARARYEETLADYRQQILIAFKDVEDALVNLKFRDEQVAAQEILVQAAKNAGSLSIGRYKQGLVTFLEVVDAERSRLQAERERNQFKTERLIASVLLIKALGGGWANEHTELLQKRKSLLKLMSTNAE